MSLTTLYIAEQGALIRREGRRLTVSKDHKLLIDMPIIKVDQVVVLGNVTVTTPALELLLDAQKQLVFLSSSGKYKGRLEGVLGGNVANRLAQFAAKSDEAKVMAICRGVAAGKLANARALLYRFERYHKRDVAVGIAESISKTIVEIESADRPARILGLEGYAARIYFQGLRAFLRPDFSFAKRVRRPPKDPVNALLSLGYTLLAAGSIGAIYAVGLDPYLGFYHTERPGRPALALDLMEEFRPVLVDALVWTCINKRIIQPGDFVADGQAVKLTPDGLNRFLYQYSSRLKKTVINPATDQKTTYLGLLAYQAREMLAVMKGDEPAYRPFRAR